MGNADNWQEIKYRAVLEEELRGLKRWREQDPALTRKDLEGTLTQLYIMDGADWGGRGEVQDISLKATIAAYEEIIAEWKGREAPPGR